MLGPARELARTLLSFVETRTRLAATELEEQSIRLVEIALWLAAALFFLGIALLFIAVLIVLHFWDSDRVLAAGLIAALFTGAGIASALVVRARMRARPKFLAATLSELQRDKEMLP
ncbi:MAG: phage holin family protein [Burkholderiales bacterium]